MKKTLSVILIIIISIIQISSCKKDKISPLAFENQSFSIYEFSYKGKRVGKIQAGVYDSRNLIFTVLEGNTDNTFTVNDTTGEIFVNKQENLIYESINKFELKVQVNDEYGDENMAIITIDIKDIATSENFIAYYTFNGNANDITGNNNHGVVHNAVLTKDQYGNENSAYYFDGQDSYIEIDPVSDVSKIGDFTLSVKIWCEGWRDQSGFPYVYIDNQYIFNGYDYKGLEISYSYYKEGQSNDQEVAEFAIQTSESGIGMPMEVQSPIQTWHHLVLTRKNDLLSIYIDKNKISTTTYNNLPMNMQHTWFIGSFSESISTNGYTNRFFGIIDEFMFLNIALDDEIIKEL